MAFCFETPKESQNCKIMNPITFGAHNFLIWHLIGDFSKKIIALEFIFPMAYPASKSDLI
jgi:hypothetical protein